MEPIQLWRRNFLRGTQPMWVDEEPKHPAYFQDFVAVRCHEFDALAAEAADARTLRAERDSLVKERERANQSVIESLAIARKALEENDRAEAVLIDKAGVDGDDLAACCEALLVQRAAATARADAASDRLARAEALLREARRGGWFTDDPSLQAVGEADLLARIDALLGEASDDDRKGVDGDAIQAQGGGRG